MALYVDFVGLNTLIEEPIDVNTNTVGDHDIDSVRNKSIQTINADDYLVALNTHRNGPYGFPIFRQLRAGQSPIIRRQRLTNIFSHYEYPGQTLEHLTRRPTPYRTTITFDSIPAYGETLTIALQRERGQPAEIFVVEFKSGVINDSEFDGSTRIAEIDPASSDSTDTPYMLAAWIRMLVSDVVFSSPMQKPKVTWSGTNPNQGVLTIEARLIPGVSPVVSAKTSTNAIRIVNEKGGHDLVKRVIPQRRGPVEHYNEVPVVSKHRPLRLVGSITTTDDKTNTDFMERVEVLTTLGNETQYFSNSKINKYFGAEDILSEDYENFVDLYLEGGIDGDESPIDEFSHMIYKQVVYPKEIYTYKNHTRNRFNFVSRYWRDNRLDRTVIAPTLSPGAKSNGFGFNVVSQSAWVLDGEQNFKDLTFQITPGKLILPHPNRTRNKVWPVASSSFVIGDTNGDGYGDGDLNSGSVPVITFPDSGTEAEQRSIALVNLGEKHIHSASLLAGDGLNNLDEVSRFTPIAGLGGFPHGGPYGNTNSIAAQVFYANDTSDPHRAKSYQISFNPYDTTTGMMSAWADMGVGQILRGRGFNTIRSDQHKTVRLAYDDVSSQYGFRIGSPDAGWQLNTTASTISTWIPPVKSGCPITPARTIGISNVGKLYLSGTLYHEKIDTQPLGGGLNTRKVSKIINFDTNFNGTVTMKLGTVFQASHDNSLVYIGANEPGAVEYKYRYFYGMNNPIYQAARKWNRALKSGTPGLTDENKAAIASGIAALNTNHFLAEINLSGSHPELGLASSFPDGTRTADLNARKNHFMANHHSVNNPGTSRKNDPKGYTRLWINGSASHLAEAYDPYKFLSGSDGNYQQQLLSIPQFDQEGVQVTDYGMDSSLHLAEVASNRDAYYLRNTDFTSLNPWTSQGFSFSYWIKFGDDPESFSAAADRDGMPIFIIEDEDGNRIIDHSIGGSNKLFRVGIRNSDGTTRLFEAERHSGYITDGSSDRAWYNVTFSLKSDGAGNMVGKVQVMRQGWSHTNWNATGKVDSSKDSEALTWASQGWVAAAPYNGALTPSDWTKVRSSKKLYVLPADGHKMIRANNAAADPDGSDKLDNVWLDDLIFFNGGLSDHQMLYLVSGSANTDRTGTAGDGKPYVDQNYFSATDNTISLKSLGGAPTLHHGRRTYELNTVRKREQSLMTGRLCDREDGYLPLGDNRTSDWFATNVIDGGTSGQFTVGMWFKPSHENFRNRSIRFSRDGQDLRGSTGGNTFNSNIGKRSHANKGFLISFWYRNNVGFDAEDHTNILVGTNNKWGISVSPTSYTTGAHRKMCLWFKSAITTGAGSGQSPSGDVLYFSPQQVPDDNDWHHYCIWWNGKTGMEATAVFQFDDDVNTPPTTSQVVTDHNAALVSTSYTVLNKHDVPLMNYTSTDYRYGVDVLHADQSITVGERSLRNVDSNICDLAIVTNPGNPFDTFAGSLLDSYLYHDGQRKSDSLVTTILNNADTSWTRKCGTAALKSDNNTGNNTLDRIYLIKQKPHYTNSYFYQNYRINQTDGEEVFFEAIADSTEAKTNWQAKADSQAGGYTVSFLFQAINHGIDEEDWRTASSWSLVDLWDGDESSNCLRGLWLYKPVGDTTGAMRGIVHLNGGHCGSGTTVLIKFNNVVQTLCDGNPHHVVLTWNGKTDGAGVPINCNMYIDNTKMATNHIYYAGVATANDCTDLPNCTTLRVGNARAGGWSLPYTYSIGSIKLFTQFIGGTNSDQYDIRKSLQYRSIGSGPSAQPAYVHVRDPSYHLSLNYQNQTVQATGYGGGQITSVDYERPVVDCLLSPPNQDVTKAETLNDDLGNAIKSKAVVNYATSIPKVEHYYRLGTEPEIRCQTMGDYIRRPLLNNTGSAPTPFSGSNVMLVDSGNKHWLDDKFGLDGDVDTAGNQIAHPSTENNNQTLFFVGDQWNGASPRTSYRGIELELSNSGGGYYLVSAMGRTNHSYADSPTLLRSKENIVVPNRWHHVQATYVGLGGTNPSVQITLNGKVVAMDTLEAGAGTLATIDGTGNYRPSIGQTARGYRPFSGFIQDVAFWNESKVANFARNSVWNTWDRIGAGSSYIDTSDSSLVQVSRTGYLQGASNSKITKIAGLEPDGGTYQGLATPNRSYITGPPIGLFRSKGGTDEPDNDGGTVIGFWSSIETTDSWHDIISFHSDARFGEEEYEEFADNDITFKDEYFNRTNTTSFKNYDDSTHVRAKISLKRTSDGKYRMRLIHVGINNIVNQERGDALIQWQIDSGDSSVTHASPTLAHHVVIIQDHQFQWYINGTLQESMALNMVYELMSSYDDIYSGEARPYMVNGWNNITVLSETNTYSSNSIIDEVGILFYENLKNESQDYKNTLASALYAGGSIYDYSLRQSNLYAWWRMGENNITNTPMVVGTNANTSTKLEDESGRSNDLYPSFSGRLQAKARTGQTMSDLTNHYRFNNTHPTIVKLPLAGAAPTQTDSVGDMDLTVHHHTSRGIDWYHDFSLTSYDLIPLNWLANEGVPVRIYFTGENADGGSPGMHRLQHPITDPWDLTGGTGRGQASLADIAIFRGVSENWSGAAYTTDKTKARIRIKLNGPPPAGSSLVLIANPRKVTLGGVDADGAAKRLFINFYSDSTSDGGSPPASDSSFTEAGPSHVPPTATGITVGHYANINVAHADTNTVEEIIDHIETLLDHSTGFNLAHGTARWSATQSGTDTLVLTAISNGGDGKWEIVGQIEGASKNLFTITSEVGHSHISKALTRSPGFGWVRQDDSDFSRSPTTNGSAWGGLGGLHTGSNGRVKPYAYYLETVDGGVNQGVYETNIGTSAGANNITWTPVMFDMLTNYAKAGYALDSASTCTLRLDNTPTLDFNDITLHTGSYFSLDTKLQTPKAPKTLIGGSTGAHAKYGPGILQNSYNQFAQQIQTGPAKTVDPQLSASACYFRRHSLTASTSFVAPFSGFLQKLSASHDDANISTHLLGDMSASHLFLGSAKWEAGEFAGRYNENGTFVFKPKKPFYDNYGAFIEEARPLMKDYGIVPEFRISDHVADYLRKGPTEQKLNFLNITGGLASADSSNKKDFYEIYSTTDFLKHFEVVQDDHSDFVDPFAIRLRCSVVKKFLPYEGFYPAQRTVQVAQQFYKSYGDNVTAQAPANLWNLSEDSKYAVQYLLNPLFSPGIMFNTIKSGVAVDYPLITDTGSVRRIPIDTGKNGADMISEQFDTRIPFEALIEPEKHLANITLASQEPDPNGSTQIETEWGGQGDQLYNLMVSNFLAETSEFFLENKSFTSLSSLPQGDPNFGNAQVGNVYMMRLKMFRSTAGRKPPGKNVLSKSYGVPQDLGSVQETFTMYSRPSAFGPPQYLSGSGYTALTWAEFKFDGTSGSMYVDDQNSPYYDTKPLPFQHDFSYVTGAVYGNLYGAGSKAGGVIGNQADLGYNYSFTPPYYHGEAWADVTFIPRETKKYTLQEIINQSSVEFYRYFAGSGSIGGNVTAADFGGSAADITAHLATMRNDGYTIEGDPAMRILLGGGRSTLSHVHDRTVLLNDQAMQIASSVNIFSQGVLEQDIEAMTAAGISNITSVDVDTDISNKYRWIIQTKFETPMLNFNQYTYGKHTTSETNANGNDRKPPHNPGAPTLPLYTDNKYGIELPGVGPMQTPIGMWHQYGHIPQNSKEGVFLQVDDVPKSWIRNAMRKPNAISKRYRSLASLCGFSTEPVRMGEVAGVKEISEAVVAIPFFERNGRRRFFSMDHQQIQFALDPTKKNLVGRTVLDMVSKMKKFVIPPSLDFVTNRKIRPFSMYIFEFTHNLTKQDLADIWQNLPPELNQTVETDEVSISHQLLAYELLGRGGKYKKGRTSEVELLRNDRLESINPEIQWMVFKVKQRAKANYFEKIFARNESQQLLSERLKTGVSADALGRKNRVSYNWPYDYFSMIEGVKLGTEVLFLNIDEEESEKQEKPVIKPKTKQKRYRKEQKPAKKRALGAVTGLVSPEDLKKESEKSDKKPLKKKGKIKRKRRLNKKIKKQRTPKKKSVNVFDRKKLK